MTPKLYAEFRIGVVESGYLLSDGKFNDDNKIHAFENIKALLEHLSVRLLQEAVERDELRRRNDED
jgi:hypothetical protein